MFAASYTIRHAFHRHMNVVSRINILPTHRGITSTNSTSERVALVTGSARGIGRAIAMRLANDGFDIALNDIAASESELQEVGASISELGRRAFVCTSDVSKDEEVQNLMTSVVRNLGSIDVMVANAGICTINPISETSVEEWDKLFSVNARGVFLCYKYASAQMIAQGKGGRIIGAASVAGKKATPGFATYGATKFAVRGLTQAAAQELAPHGITVNAYAPGLINTRMMHYLQGVPPEKFGANPVDINKPINSLGYNGEPEDVAGLVSYLASPEARFITGQSIAIDGGFVFD